MALSQTDLDNLDALISSLLSGATSLTELYGRKFGQLEINSSTSLKEIMEFRNMMKDAIIAEDQSGDAWQETHLR